MQLEAFRCIGKFSCIVGGGGENTMSEIRLRKNESLDSALRRFKRATAKDGILAEVKKRRQYDKPSVARKKKSEAARKRKKY